MSKGKRKTPAPPRRPTAQPKTEALVPDWVIVGIAGFGMLITAYLTAAHWLDDSPAFCAAGSGCDLIRQSRWSTVLGLPVALWGFAVYALLALMAWRMPARLKRWRRLWYLALIGFAISVYLTVVGLVSLDAVCPWCLASLASITAILLSLLLRRPESAPGMPWPQWLGQSGIMAVVALVLLHLWYSDLLTHPDTPKLEALASHLQQVDARYYGAWWCPACQEQKRLFRGAGEKLPFVECSTGGRGSPMNSLCRDRGIDSYPTWIIDGRHYTGTLTPQELARYTGFDWKP